MTCDTRIFAALLLLTLYSCVTPSLQTAVKDGQKWVKCMTGRDPSTGQSKCYGDCEKFVCEGRTDGRNFIERSCSLSAQSCVTLRDSCLDGDNGGHAACFACDTYLCNGAVVVTTTTLLTISCATALLLLFQRLGRET